MKKTLVLLLLLVAAIAMLANKKESLNIFETATAPVKPVTDKVVERVATDIQTYALKGTRFEQANKERELKRNKQTLRVTRSVKDCIKPGDLIDDEVQMCVNGTMEKTW